MEGGGGSSGGGGGGGGYCSMRGTTILAIKRDRRVVIAGDGQVTFGNTVLKSNAIKIRKMMDGRILSGFAGSTADAFALYDRFEKKLKEHGGKLGRAAVELGKDWRTDKMLRRLEAFLVVADQEQLLLLSGNGDVVEPEGGICGIGSGGPYALAAARALLRHDPDMDLAHVVQTSMEIAAEICIYTNTNITMEELKG